MKRNLTLLDGLCRGVHNAANQPPKKRKYSDSPPGTLTPGLLMNTLGVGNILPIKPEPCPPDLRYGTSAERPMVTLLRNRIRSLIEVE